jgi:hypothetical protein
MPRSKPVDEVLGDAEQIARVWTDNPTFVLGDLTLTQFQANITNLRNLRNAVENLRTQLTAAVNDSSSQTIALSDSITRARSGFRAFFGPDSTQYEQAGGTRRSERKRPTRKPKTT